MAEQTTPVLPSDLLRMCGEHGQSIDDLKHDMDQREQEMNQLFDLQRTTTVNVNALAVSIATMKALYEQDHDRVDTLWCEKQQDDGAAKSNANIRGWLSQAIAWLIAIGSLLWSHFTTPRH